MKEPETGKKENTGKSGYSITTWRLHLWCRHPEWLRTTQEFYNRIAEFYYNLLLDHTDLWEMGSQQTLRELEIMSIPGRGGRIPSDPLPWQKVPLYFRRAAANEGIASAKSYLSRFAQDEKIGRAEKLNAAVTYYKGMYQDFSAKEITLRVWTGETWTWMHCRLSGRDFPENARLMSPSVVFEYKYDMLHVPVRQNNENTATVRQRMQAGCRILCIQFTNSDVLFFCVGYNDELDQTLEFAKNLANEKNMELLYLSNQDIWYKHRELHHCGAASPCEFLGYIRNASYVVTNSFHATAFSIIFHREFYSEIGLKRNGRIKNILNLTGLQDHAINRGINKENTFKGKIDWSKVDVRLNLEKEKSYKFLRSVVDLIEK